MRYLKNFSYVAVIIAATLVSISVFSARVNAAAEFSCGNGHSNSIQECFRQHATTVRNQAFNQALSQIQTPAIHNFPMRRLLSDFTVRQSLGHHPWYIYQTALGGNVLRYFVSKSYPVNSCDFLETTQSVNWDNDGGNFLTQLPPLEGVYQSSNDDCATYVFEDQVTSAIETVPIANAIISDKPILFHEKPVKVKITK